VGVRLDIMAIVQRASFTATLAAALAAAAANANGQDIAAGQAFAREACNACHVTQPDERGLRRFEVGPAFRDIANTPGMTATALQLFLTSSHPKMPNLILTPEEKADVIAYILSLRNPH
jgi:cytochrome c